jgi:hypothetical protein
MKKRCIGELNSAPVLRPDLSAVLTPLMATFRTAEPMPRVNTSNAAEPALPTPPQKLPVEKSCRACLALPQTGIRSDCQQS